MRDILRRFLGIEEIEVRINEIDTRLLKLESHIHESLGRMGKYATQNREDLMEMKSNLNGLLGVVQNLQETAASESDKNRANNLARRIRNHITRANNAFEKSIA